MCQTDQRNFWKEIRCTMNSNVKLPTCIDGVHGDCNIAAMWKHHYSTIFNRVPNSCCAKAHDDIFNNTNIVFDNEINVNVEEMKTIVNGLACNKSPGLDGVSAEHMKFAGHKLCVLMSMVISSIFTHGFIPRSMMESVIVPVIKNKNKRINDKGNYRPICLSNVCSKIVEMALARRLSDYLHSSHNQFGFKLDHGTELCVFTFKELLRFYVEHGSAMHVAFLDASKAFDRVNRCKILTKLENRGVAKYILRLISYDFISQHICIRWGNSYSDFFTSTNGVKQGGILSPLFFNVYMDNLSAQLNSQHIGCSTGDVVVNHMLYADDIALFSPSAKGLQKLLDMCFTYGCSHDIQFNPLTSVVMYIDSRKLGAARPMVIGSDQLNFVSYYTYLGHIICDDLSDESDMKAKAKQIYARSNMLRQRFHFCSADVKNKLFSTFFNNIYMCALWVKCTKSTFHMFIVSYNNCYRILHRLPMRCSASGMFAAANVNSGSAVFRKCVYSLMTRINRSSNDIICNVANGDVYLLSTLRRRWLIQLYNF